MLRRRKVIKDWVACKTCHADGWVQKATGGDRPCPACHGKRGKYRKITVKD